MPTAPSVCVCVSTAPSVCVSTAPSVCVSTAPSVCAHISLLVILCIIVYVTKKQKYRLSFFSKPISGKISVNRYIGRSLIIIASLLLYMYFKSF